MTDMNLEAIPVMKFALQQIQELHTEHRILDVYSMVWPDGDQIWLSTCKVCDNTGWPCDTRKMADEGLGVE